MLNHLKKDYSDVVKQLFWLALPMSGSQFINFASTFLCMTMLAALGHNVLAASALIFTSQAAIMMSAMAILFSLSVLVGHAYGARNYDAIGNYLQQSWFLSLILAIPVILLFWHIGPILLYFHEPENIVNIVARYFHYFVFAVIPAMLVVCNTQFGYAVRKKWLIATSSLLSVSILLLVSYLLIFGKWGLPKLGVAGLSLGVTAQYTFFLIFTTTFFYLDKAFSKFNIFQIRFYRHLDHLVKMFKIGWPICIQMGGEMFSFFVGGILVGWLGVRSLAAFQVVNQYYFLIIVPIFVLSQASGILVGFANGQKNYAEIRKICHASLGLVLLFGFFVAILFLAFPKELAKAYMNVNDPKNAMTLHLTVLLFSLMAFSQIFDAVRNVLIGTLRGLFDTRFPMYMSLTTIWLIGMPISYLLAFTCHFGVVGYVLGGMVGMIIGVIIMLLRWRYVIKWHDRTNGVDQ